VYSILANGPAGELPQPFLDAFAIAYEQASHPPARKSAGSASQETG